jgi:iron(III) transport system ATP-binding protein
VAASTAISLTGVTKRFGDATVLDGLDLEVPAGEITAVLGASGSGKTTLLRLIAGFERVDAGTLRVAGRVVDDGRHVLAARHRGVGYVPQEGALFPHLTVRGNIAFGLRRNAQQSVQKLLALIGLSNLEERYPHELSGGQQQRVALARALAVAPALVLLDEPFGALDASLRGELRKDVARILAETGTTAVLVTHDQDEALALASQIALLADGVVTARAAPRVLYHNPPNPAAAAAIGQANLLPA